MQPSASRREFLKRSALLAAAGAAVPYVWTSPARAAESKNDKLNVAVIGLGERGTAIGDEAGKLGAVLACCDVHQGRAAEFAQRFGGPEKCKPYGDYRKLLDEMKTVDAVLIATPDHWHARIAADAMQAGKDVYCESPLTLTIAEGKRLAEIARQTGRVVQVGTLQRSEFGGVFLEAAAIARSGRLGQKLSARASVGEATAGGPFPTAEPPTELNWDLWLGPAPEVPFCANRFGRNFRWWFDYSGGQVTDWGIHHVDIALWALGGEESGVVEVEGKGHFPLGRELTLDYLLGKKPVGDLPNSYNVAASFDVNLTLANGNRLNLNSNGNDLYLEGDQGHLAVNRRDIRGKLVEDIKKDPAGKQWLEGQVAALCRGKPPTGHIKNFFDCVKDRSRPVSDIFSHIPSANACHIANIAMLLNRKVRWDAANGQFADDAEANQLAGRKQRTPWAIEA